MSSTMISGNAPMSMMPAQNSTSDQTPSNKQQASSDPTTRILSQDDIRLAVKAADQQSSHHDIREYVEATGVAIGVAGTTALLINTHRRWKKAGIAARSAVVCR